MTAAGLVGKKPAFMQYRKESRDTVMAKLCLGTVQFGMKYGINNTLGQPAKTDVFEILDMAYANGIQTIDTACAYGSAENILGEYFEHRKNADSFQIISKLRPNVIEENAADIHNILRREFLGTLQRLRVERINGYLLHTPQYIYNEKLLEELRKLKREGLVEHIGVSIYDLQEGYAALEAEEIDYIQLPYSILDQRGIQSGFIQEAKEHGVTIFTRSAFLQGLFMMDKKDIPEYLKHGIPYLDAFERLRKKYSVNKVTALLQFVGQEKDIDYLVFGVDTKEQLAQDINAFYNQDVPEAFLEELKGEFVNIEKSIIFPSLWSNGKKAE